MKVAIFTKESKHKAQDKELDEGRRALEEALRVRGIEIIDAYPAFNCSATSLSAYIDMVISIGGDGTLLGAVHRIGSSGIPVVGINFGHLGFLTTAGRDDIEKLADSLHDGDYAIEPRTMLRVTVNDETKHVEEQFSALNEVYLHRSEQSPLLHTKVVVDGDAMATYSGDGIIVATPTGSTAYSLSCGGPILAPGSGSFVITPIAAHTLTQRPIILSDTAHIALFDENQDAMITLGVDSFVMSLSGKATINVQKADYTTNLVRICHQNFFSAIRDKLMWGL